MRQISRYGKLVWEDEELEKIRKDKCLCHRCELFAPKERHNCFIAEKFFKVCVEHGCAFILNRCERFIPNEKYRETMYFDGSSVFTEEEWRKKKERGQDNG